jgi:phosphatidylserine/phosphatidylglycerophosphate/cardiolipin synthase-like enzyme
VYIHCKTLIADDRYVLTGSANISTTSLEHHSELDVLVEDPARAADLRWRLWREHLQLTPQQLPPSFADGAALWRAHADENLARLRKNQPTRSRVLPLRKLAGSSGVGSVSLSKRLHDDPMANPMNDGASGKKNKDDDPF